ncbi:MAG: flagellar FliJ family protein [Hyphomonadaceae bacterium]
MKSLRTLLKLARRDLETLRRALADQIARLNGVEARMRGHEQTIQQEQQLAAQDYQSASAYGGYALRAIAGRKALQSERDMVLAEMERLRVLITEAHTESRKFERLIELEEAREKAKREKRENDELDEFATMRAARTPG